MILSILFSIVSFVAVLFVLVIAHEWGHFFVARRFGVRVYVFGFGFPPKIAKIFHKNGTDYTANWIPLGGFVRLKGEDGSDAKDTDSFAHKKVWQRLAILLAGVVMNFALGYAIFFGLNLYGVDAQMFGNETGAQISNQRVVIGSIMKGGPAERAGLQMGDVIESVGGDEEAPGKIVGTHQFREFVGAHAKKELAVSVVREGMVQKISITPEEIQPGVVGIGVSIADIARVKYPFVAAAKKAGADTIDISLLIFKTLGTIVQKLVQDGELQQGVSGPVGIAVVTGQVAKSGAAPLLQLMAMLSINLGVLNVLPIPSLDGGRALFVILEKIVRRKVRADIEQYSHVIGFALLMLLVIAVTFRDVMALVK